MSSTLHGAVIALLMAMLAEPTLAQTEQQRADNLRTCLSGKYPALCKKDWLAADQLQRAAEAERRENLTICLTGKYPALCKHGLLAEEERARVDAAEKRENLAICLTGKYKALCKHQMLSATESSQVAEAERRENLSMCLNGRYPSLCNKGLLTKEQLAHAEAAEQRARASAPSTSARAGAAPRVGGYRGRRSDCETGHWVDSVSNSGEIVKLEDGSIWQVDLVDRIDTMLWLPITDIIVCDDRLINADDNETVQARRLR